jgi:transcriptional regulator with XRE-family HTH domain
MARTTIGRNVLERRTLMGLSQRDLAERIGKTREYISLIENGRTPLDKRSTLIALAEALRCDINDLTGQPYAPTAHIDLALIAAIPLIRASLNVPERDPGEPQSLRRLEVAAGNAMAARMACQPAKLGEFLPGLITDARGLWYNQGDPAAGELLVKALVTGSLAIKPAGYIDLALRMAELADQVAKAHGNPVCIAAAQFALAQCLLAVGDRTNSARVAAGGADQLDQLTRIGGLPPALHNDILAWMTMLHLHAALVLSGLGSGDPQGRLDAAGVASRGVVGNPWLMEATPANVQVWSEGIAIENGNPDLALQLVRRVDVNSLHSPQRRARLWLDGGRAAHLTGDHTTAIHYLLLAEDAAPGDLRNRAQVVDMVSHLIREANDRGSDELRRLADAVGVNPAHPEPVS